MASPVAIAAEIAALARGTVFAEETRPEQWWYSDRLDRGSAALFISDGNLPELYCYVLLHAPGRCYCLVRNSSPV